MSDKRHIQAIPSLVDNQTSFDIPEPYCSFSGHTLAVSDAVVGFGKFPSCRIISASLDCSVKVQCWLIG